MRIKSDSVVWSDVGDEIVGLDLDRSEYFSANDTATVLVKRLTEGDATPEELTDELVTHFQVDPVTAAAGVDRFVGVLRARNMLED
jgi:Coenzyme PQQ synthesis protein D (PqqD)